MSSRFSEERIQELLATKITPFYKLKDQNMIDELYELKKKLNEENITRLAKYEEEYKQATKLMTTKFDILKESINKLLKESIDDSDKP